MLRSSQLVQFLLIVVYFWTVDRYARIFQFEDFRGMETKVRGYIKALRGRYQRELVQQFSGSANKKDSTGGDEAGDNELEAESLSDSHAVPGRYVAIVLKDVPVGKIRKLRQERAVVRRALKANTPVVTLRHMFGRGVVSVFDWCCAFCLNCRLYRACFRTSSDCPLSIAASSAIPPSPSL